MRFLSLLCLGLLVLATAARPALAQEGRGYALVIGIQSYANLRHLPQLKYRERDARQLSEFLRSREGGEFDVTLVLNDSASRGRIFTELRNLGRKAHREDVVYIYFTGHGVPDDGLAYLLPYDASDDEPAAYGLRADQFLSEVKRRIGAKTIVIFIDACYSGAAGSSVGRTMGGNGMYEALREAWARELDDDRERIMGFFSAGSNQPSWEDNQMEQGVFTYFLLQGLRGEADAIRGNNDGTVRAGELEAYLHERVASYTRSRFPSEQNPRTTPFFDPQLILSVYRGPGPARGTPPQLSEGTRMDTPADFLQLFNRGLNAYARGDTAAAVAAWEAAAKADLSRPDAFFNLGVVHSRRGAWENAIRAYRQALLRIEGLQLDTEPQDIRRMRNEAVSGLMSAGTSLFTANRLREADEAFKIAITVAPYYRDAWYNRALTLYKLGKWAELVPVAQRATVFDPLNYNLHIILFNAYKGRSEELKAQGDGPGEQRMRNLALRTLSQADSLPVDIKGFSFVERNGVWVATAEVSTRTAVVGSLIELQLDVYSLDGVLLTREIEFRTPARAGAATFEFPLQLSEFPLGYAYRVAPK